MVSTSILTTAIATNGLWTGHDWSDTVNGVDVRNGILEGLNDSMKQHLASAAVYPGADLDDVYLDLPNVMTVQSVLS